MNYEEITILISKLVQKPLEEVQDAAIYWTRKEDPFNDEGLNLWRLSSLWRYLDEEADKIHEVLVMTTDETDSKYYSVIVSSPYTDKSILLKDPKAAATLAQRAFDEAMERRDEAMDAIKEFVRGWQENG